MKKAKALMSLAMGSAMALTAVGVVPTVTAAKASTPKPITLSIYFGVQAQNYDQLKSPVSKAIEKKTGVKLKVEFPVGDTTQKEGLMIASGDLPDMIMAHGTNSVTKLVATKSVINMKPLIDKYGSNIKKMYGNFYKRNQYSLKDKGIYFLGTQPLNPTNATLDTSNSFNVQLDLLKEQGYPQLKTVYDLEKALTKYVKKHPKINGQKTIGFSLIADDFRFFCSVSNGGGFAAGYPDDGNWIVNPKTFACKNIFLDSKVKEYFKWVNHMNAIGLLDPEALVQKQDQYIAKLSTGRVVSTLDPVWNWSSTAAATLRNKYPWRQFAQFGLGLTPNTKVALNQAYGYSPSEGTSITKKCKNPKRAIQYLDYLCSQEGQILTHWGVKGINYEVDKNGKRYRTAKQIADALKEGFAQKSGIGFYLSSIFPCLDGTVLDSTGQTYAPASSKEERAAQGYSKEEKEVLSHYKAYDGGKAVIWNDLQPSYKDFPVRPWGRAWEINLPGNSKNVPVKKKIEDLAKVGIPKAILAKPGEFNKVWDGMCSDMRAAGSASIEKEMQKLVKEQVEKFN